MRKETDPTAKFAGVGGSFSAGVDGYAEEKEDLEEKLNLKKNSRKC
ncbi:hypothetical protein PG911_08455 [Tenacibaculum ovolyticum]|nr:hypothetical protein [Tenacibaculum ovolyticum]WBX78275.1 hypothetical protein PG911_08455 [Tenacibaculum ovolyticum]